MLERSYVKLFIKRSTSTSNFEEFCEIAATNRACVLLINTKDLNQITHKAHAYFSKRFGEDSSFAKTVFAIWLFCPGCTVEFPHSYILSLQWVSIGASQQLDNFSGSVTPGFKEFGQTGICPRCGSGQSFYVYDNIDPETITQSDLDAIREYWRYNAQQWWRTQSKTQGFCDICESPVPRDAGYFDGVYLLCEETCNKRLGTDALEKLRRDPDHFGIGEVRKARYFVSNKHIPPRIRSNRDLSEEELDLISDEWGRRFADACFDAIHANPQASREEIADIALQKTFNIIMQKYGLSQERATEIFVRWSKRMRA